MLNFGGVSNQGKQASEQVFCQRFGFVSAEACNSPQCPETLEKGHGPLSLCHSTQACGFLPAGSSRVIEVEAFKTNSEKFLLSSMSLLHKIQTHAKTGPMPQAERSWMGVECIDSSERSTLWQRMACDFFSIITHRLCNCSKYLPSDRSNTFFWTASWELSSSRCTCDAACLWKRHRCKQMGADTFRGASVWIWRWVNT